MVIVLPDSPDDEAVDDATALTPPEPEEHDAPTGPDLDAGPPPTGAVRRPAGSAGRALRHSDRRTGGPDGGPPVPYGLNFNSGGTVFVVVVVVDPAVGRVVATGSGRTATHRK